MIMIGILVGIVLFFLMILSLEAVPSNMTVFEFVKLKLGISGSDDIKK